MTSAAQSPGILVADLGGTRLRAALFDPDGSMRSHIVEPTPAADPAALVHTLARAREQGGDLVSHAVIGVPGVVDYDAGLALALPQLPAWHEVSAASLSEALGVSVTLANDADLAALGEHRFGAGAGTQHLVYVTCSTGVGAGVVVGGRLLRTRYSLGEIGHTIIDWHSGRTVEQEGSGSGIAARTNESAASIAARAANGDAEAAAQFGRLADALGVGVMTMVLCFMPDRVVIGGGVSQAGDLLLDPVRARIRLLQHIPFTAEQIVRSQLGDDSGLQGAYVYWHDELAGR
jgi:glucokinase